MTIREKMEKMEQDTLSPFATLSAKSKGREREEEACDIRPAFQRDRDRILHCKAFRRLKNKTQVFLTPKGDHYRTRMSHTLEVSQNARTIAKALRLNEDLVEAIALGHDLGHTPFGHAGEYVLNALCEDGFRHNEQSVRIVERLEKDGDINHDIDDAIRAQIMVKEDIPKELRDILGHTTRERLNTLIHNIVINSIGKDDICMSKEVEDAMYSLRRFLFEHVYKNPAAKREEEKARGLLRQLYFYYMEHFERIPKKYVQMLMEGEKKERVVCDYISGMTDQYAIAKFEEYYLPLAWQVDGYSHLES